MLDRVKAIIERQLGRGNLQITEETDMLSDLDINSLELVELVCLFEVEFDIEVPEKDIRKFSKVGDIVAYLEATEA